MSWRRYDLTFKLLSPLHIGWRKTGNLQQTRGYVPGKNQWAALTARLTREYDDGADGRRYQKIGEKVQENLRFSYLYPALFDGTEYKVHYPWKDDFDYLFLDSYASTAIDYASQSAAEGLLHETEFIAPHTRDGCPVYLTGQVYAQTHLPAPLDKWQDVLDKLQFGGEQGYGWGRVRRVSCKQDDAYDTTKLTVQVAKNDPITAHLKAANTTGVIGPIEPLIGWERNNKDDKPNWSLSKEAVICYAPGAIVTMERDFTLGRYSVWEEVSD